MTLDSKIWKLVYNVKEKRDRSHQAEATANAEAPARKSPVPRGTEGRVGWSALPRDVGPWISLRLQCKARRLSNTSCIVMCVDFERSAGSRLPGPRSPKLAGRKTQRLVAVQKRDARGSRKRGARGQNCSGLSKRSVPGCCPFLTAILVLFVWDLETESHYGLAWNSNLGILLPLTPQVLELQVYPTIPG